MWKVVIFGSNGGNFCSGGDVHDIIGPADKDMKGFSSSPA
jgi:enoyl-CoA hydratase/carnithine racemase